MRILKNVLYNFFRINKKEFRYNVRKFDYSVLISGSFFSEYPEYKVEDFCEIIKTNVPYYIIGVNFGPYNTVKYFNDCTNLFKNSEDVCFRDMKSYELFNKLKNVRYAPDIVFGLDLSNVEITNNKIVILSVCNIDKNGKNNYYSQDEYESNIIELINFFTKKGYKCKLISFSKGEGDEDVVNSILNKTDNEIDYYFYRDNIEEALNVLGDSSIIVGTRYHANILGMIMNKTVIPIAYSNKMINVLNDLNFKGKYFDLNKKDCFNVDSLTDKDLNYKLNVDKYIEYSKNHFKELDKVLK